MKSRLGTFLAISFMIIGLMSSGCGVSTTSSTLGTTNNSINGTVSDGPIINADVWLDLDGDGILDAGEPSAKSGNAGGFSITGFTDIPANVHLLAKKGTDQDTNLPFEGVLKSPLPSLSASANSTTVVRMISPVTTLRSYGVSDNQIRSLFPSLPNTNLLELDPTINDEIKRANVSLHSVATQMAKAKNSQASAQDFASVYEGIADHYKAMSTVNVNFHQTNFANVLTSTKIGLDATKATSIAQILQGTAQQMSALDMTSTTERDALIQIQKVAISDISHAITAFISGIMDGTDLIAQYKPANLESFLTINPLKQYQGSDMTKLQTLFGFSSVQAANLALPPQTVADRIANSKLQTLMDVFRLFGISPSHVVTASRSFSDLATTTLQTSLISFGKDNTKSAEVAKIAAQMIAVHDHVRSHFELANLQAFVKNELSSVISKYSTGTFTITTWQGTNLLDRLRKYPVKALNTYLSAAQRTSFQSILGFSPADVDGAMLSMNDANMKKLETLMILVSQRDGALSNHGIFKKLKTLSSESIRNLFVTTATINSLFMNPDSASTMHVATLVHSAIAHIANAADATQRTEVFNVVRNEVAQAMFDHSKAQFAALALLESFKVADVASFLRINPFESLINDGVDADKLKTLVGISDTSLDLKKLKSFEPMHRMYAAKMRSLSDLLAGAGVDQSILVSKLNALNAAPLSAKIIVDNLLNSVGSLASTSKTVIASITMNVYNQLASSTSLGNSENFALSQSVLNDAVKAISEVRAGQKTPREAYRIFGNIQDTLSLHQANPLDYARLSGVNDQSLKTLMDNVDITSSPTTVAQIAAYLKLRILFALTESASAADAKNLVRGLSGFNQSISSFTETDFLSLINLRTFPSSTTSSVKSVLATAALYLISQVDAISNSTLDSSIKIQDLQNLASLLPMMKSGIQKAFLAQMTDQELSDYIKLLANPLRFAMDKGISLTVLQQFFGVDSFNAMSTIPSTLLDHVAASRLRAFFTMYASLVPGGLNSLLDLLKNTVFTTALSLQSTLLSGSDAEISSFVSTNMLSLLSGTTKDVSAIALGKVLKGYATIPGSVTGASSAALQAKVIRDLGDMDSAVLSELLNDVKTYSATGGTPLFGSLISALHAGGLSAVRSALAF